MTMAQLWGGRFTKQTDQLVFDFNASITFDKRLFHEDVTGSIVHATMLAKQGILTEEEKKNFDYDMAIFFSPAGIKALHEDFPDMKPGDIKIATFGPATAKAVREMGLSLDLEAPTERYPSMTGALRHFLQEEEE